MALSESEIKELKDQLKSQIANLPKDKRAEAEKQINSMSTKALEALVKEQSQAPPVYRNIVSGQIPAIKVGENPEAIAVLDIKPISKGHIVIIPKNQAKTPDAIPK